MHKIRNTVALLFFALTMANGSEIDSKSIMSIGRKVSIHSHPKVGPDNKEYTILIIEEEVLSIDLKKIVGVEVSLKDKENLFVCEASLENSSNKTKEKNKIFSTYIVTYSNELIENSKITLSAKDNNSKFTKSLEIPMRFFVENKIINSEIYKTKSEETQAIKN